MKYLEDNYISVVTVVDNHSCDIENKIKDISNVLSENFKNYELIVVDNNAGREIRDKIENLSNRYVHIYLPVTHDSQSVIAAGSNVAIGDYIVEIPDLSLEIDYNIIIDMYKKCQEGNDFVFLTPKKTSFLSNIFYKILNKNLKSSIKSSITSSIMTLLSRRGFNKTADLGNKMENRSLSYILSGLKYDNIVYDMDYDNYRTFSQNYKLMMQTFIYYTDVILKAAQKISMLFFSVSIFFIFYSLYSYFFKNVISGWTSTVVVISIGFSGVFLIFSIIIRYLDNILKIVSNKKDYIYGSIEKKSEGEDI